MALLAERLPSLATATPDAAKGYELTKTGIVFHRVLADAEYEVLGRKVAGFANASRWQRGDWLIAGTGRYEDGGSAYERMRELTGCSLDTVSTYLKVAMAYAHDERGLAPWTFYKDALRLPTGERLRVLQLAAMNKWTRVDLVDFINRRLGVAGDDAVGAAADVEALARRIGQGPSYVRQGRPKGQSVCCPNCQHVFEPRGRWVRKTA